MVVSKPGTMVSERFTAEGVKVFECNIANDGDIIAMFKLNRLFRKFKPDIVELVNQKAYWIGAILCRIHGVKCVINRNISSLPKRKGLFAFLINKLCDKVIAVSNSIKDTLHHELGTPKDKVRVIHPSIDINPYLKYNAESTIRDEFNLSGHFIFTYIGRIEKAKGVFILVKAFSKLVSINNQSRLMLVGQPSDKDINQLKELIRGSGVQDKIIITGFRRDIKNILSGSDVYVHPSPSEGLPLSIIEASVMAKPIISTTAGGIGELIIDDDNGFLFEPYDEDKLLSLMSKAIKEYDYMKRLGMKAKERAVKSMNLNRMVNEYIMLYDNLLKNCFL
jgi:glycosyltransferase involved in cell wall biosynthesis